MMTDQALHKIAVLATEIAGIRREITQYQGDIDELSMHSSATKLHVSYGSKNPYNLRIYTGMYIPVIQNEIEILVRRVEIALDEINHIREKDLEERVLKGGK